MTANVTNTLWDQKSWW